jgi:hypothetical protein
MKASYWAALVANALGLAVIVLLVIDPAAPGEGRLRQLPQAAAQALAPEWQPYDDLGLRGWEEYELTELGKQFVHYTMHEIVPKLASAPH